MEFTSSVGKSMILKFIVIDDDVMKTVRQKDATVIFGKHLILTFSKESLEIMNQTDKIHLKYCFSLCFVMLF